MRPPPLSDQRFVIRASPNSSAVSSASGSGKSSSVREPREPTETRNSAGESVAAPKFPSEAVLGELEVDEVKTFLQRRFLSRLVISVLALCLMTTPVWAQEASDENEDIDDTIDEVWETPLVGGLTCDALVIGGPDKDGWNIKARGHFDCHEVVSTMEIKICIHHRESSTDRWAKLGCNINQKNVAFDGPFEDGYVKIAVACPRATNDDYRAKVRGIATDGGASDRDVDKAYNYNIPCPDTAPTPAAALDLITYNLPD